MEQLLHLLQFIRWLTLAAILATTLTYSTPSNVGEKTGIVKRSLVYLPLANSQIEDEAFILPKVDKEALSEVIVNKENPLEELNLVSASSVIPRVNSSRLDKDLYTEEHNIISDQTISISTASRSSKLKFTPIPATVESNDIGLPEANSTLTVHPIKLIVEAGVDEKVCNRNIARPYRIQGVNEELFLINQLSYADMLLSDEMFVYHQEGKYYLPLEFLSELLLLPIQVDIDNKSAQGWFIEQNREVNISQLLMQYWANNSDCGSDSTELFHDDWDIYIDVKVLAQMFGFNITFDSARQIFSIAESDNIPLSQLLARQKRFEQFSKVKALAGSEEFKEFNSEYAHIGDLAINADLGARRQSLIGQSDTTIDGYIQAKMDILNHESYLSYSSSSELGETITGYIHKELTESWVNSYRIGSISSHSLALVSDANTGVGAYFDAGATFTNDIRHIVVEGVTEPGWDVELYRNNGLIDVQRVQADGVYRFFEVPYYIGLNQYQLRFYGPSGELKTESFSKLLDNSVMEQGSIGVSAGAMKREQDDLKQYYADFNWAMLDNLTAGISLIQQQDSDKQWQFLPTLSVNIVGESELLQLNYVHTEDGHAASIAMQGRLKDVDWQAEWQNYNNFSSWDNVDGRITHDANVQLSGFFKSSGVNWGLGGDWQAYQSGVENTQVNFNLSGQLSLINLSNELRWSSLIETQKWVDRIAVSGRLGNWSLRSYVELELAPAVEFKQWVTNINSAISDAANYQLELRYQPNSEGDFSSRNSLSYLFDYGTLRLAVDNYATGDWLAQLRWNSSLLWETTDNRWLIDRNSFINTGSVKIIAFQDDNANGLFDANEAPLSGLQFSGHSSPNNMTDNNGELLITQLHTNRGHKLALNERSLPDPFLVPVASIIKVNAHPGFIQPIAFPVMFTAEVEGYVYQFSHENQQAAKGVKVRLKSTASDKEYFSRVEYDGVFIFEQVTPGEYELWVRERLIQLVSLKPGDFQQLDEIVL